MNQLIVVAVFWILITQISGIFWDDFRVRFGPAPSEMHFVRLPRLARDAISQGWSSVNSSTCENDGRFFGHRYKLKDDDLIYLLFDSNGVISGIQTLYPHEAVITPETIYRYDLEPMFQNETVNGKVYAVLTAYFMLPETICTTGRIESELLSKGTATGIWFQNGPNPNSLRSVPRNRRRAASVGWTNCECVPGMGNHNFWKVDEWLKFNCTTISPTQILFTPKDELLGFVFQVFGPATDYVRFEKPSLEAAVAIVGPSRAPSCLDKAIRTDISSFHVYFVDNPWNIKCNK